MGGIGCADSRLSAAGWTHQQSTGAGVDAAAKELIELANAARDHVMTHLRMMFGCDQPRINDNSTGFDRKVVIALAEPRTPHLANLQPAPLDAEIPLQTL